MQEFVVHGVPGSPFGRSVLLALEEKAVRYRLQPLSPQAMRSAEHLVRHPFGKVPVLEHEGFCLYETQAILRYIDRVCPQPALTPAQPRAAARMDQLMNVNDWYLFQGVSNVIPFQRIIMPRLLGLSADETAIAAALPRAQHVIDVLARELGARAYFTGESLSLADLLLAPQLDFLAQTPEWEPLTARHANLSRWLGSMRERASMAATTWERVAAMARAA